MLSLCATAIASTLLIKGFLQTNGIDLAPLHFGLWPMPTVLLVRVVHVARLSCSTGSCSARPARSLRSGRSMDYWTSYSREHAWPACRNRCLSDPDERHIRGRFEMNLTRAMQCVIVTILIELPAYAWAQIPLEEFRKIVGEACKYPPLESHGSKTELSGSFKAGVNGLLRILAGAEGSASGTKTEAMTSGVKQDQLAVALKNGNDCSSAMWLGFKDKIVTTPTASGSTPAIGRVLSDRSTAPTLRRISVGAFAIGDTIEKVQNSGIQGQFGRTRDNHTAFNVETSIPIRNAHGYRDMKSMVSYVFDKGIISRIVLFTSQPGGCD